LEHSVPQLIPGGLLVTTPSPDLANFSVAVSTLNVAVHDLLAPMSTVPSKQSESPLQPANREPVEGTAVKETTVPDEYVSEQSLPQLIPPGLLVTLPLPLPSLPTAEVTATESM
jgi:hypothetical protein